VFADAALADMARRAPTTRDEFLAVSGVGTAKLERYGDAFLAAIAGA
jgi:ATP-dependent DNA helicase RecQ